MAKWKKGQKEFTVSPNYDESRGCMIVIPKPITEILDLPKKFTFKITGKRVSITGED